MSRIVKFLAARLSEDVAYARDLEAAGADARRLRAEIFAKRRLITLYTDARQRVQYLEGWLEVMTKPVMTPGEREERGEVFREVRDLHQRVSAYWSALHAVAEVYAEHGDYRPL